MKVTDYNGVECHLDDAGNFTASVGGKNLRKKSLDQLKRAIDASNARGVKAVYVVSSNYDNNGLPIVKTISHFEKRTYWYRARGKDGTLHDGSEEFYVYDKQAHKKLVDLYDQESKIREQRGEILKSLTLLTPDNIKTVAEQQAKEES
jgi:hypothetical protein